MKAAVEFTRRDDVYFAASEHGRRWRIWPIRIGWRMEFRDPGDLRPTYAGTFSTLRAAQAEACRATGGTKGAKPGAP